MHDLRFGQVKTKPDRTSKNGRTFSKTELDQTVRSILAQRWARVREVTPLVSLKKSQGGDIGTHAKGVHGE